MSRGRFCVIKLEGFMAYGSRLMRRIIKLYVQESTEEFIVVMMEGILSWDCNSSHYNNSDFEDADV